MSRIACVLTVCWCAFSLRAEAGIENYLELRSTSAVSAMQATPQGYDGSMGYGGTANGQAISVGWMLSGHFGFELSMRDYGDYNGGSTLCPIGVGCTQNVAPARGEADGRAGMLVFGWTLKPGLDLQARGGFQRWSTEVSAGNERAQDGGTDGIYGVALQWRPLAALSFTLGVEDHELAHHGLEFGARVHF